jgi:ATP-dependent RNA helicase DeaD/ATP-dependent RNA helicase RhlE
VSTFSELGVSARVSDVLAKRNITEPFKIQGLVLEDAIAGRDVLARSKTGSGKTLAFGLPIVERVDPSAKRPSALVLVPTRELATQVTDELTDVARAQNLRIVPVYGGVSLPDQAKRAAQAHIVVATPGRLQDLMDRRLLSVNAVEILVLDEADRMLDMGFRPQVDKIVKRVPRDRQTMFFSATLDGQVGQLARAYTHDAVLHEVHSATQTVDAADHNFVPVTQNEKVSKLVELVKEQPGTTLVFVRTKRGADRLAYRLKKQGLNAVPMHADLTQAARRKALQQLASGKAEVLVATDVAARGLDLDNIEHVINFDPPNDHKDYLHRVGRTARAGRSGTGTTLVLPDQQHEVSRLAARLKLEEEFEENGMVVAPPQSVFRSHKGGRSMMRPRPKRKF